MTAPYGFLTNSYLASHFLSLGSFSALIFPQQTPSTFYPKLSLQVHFQ